MWECNSCQFYNDDRDGKCIRCEISREESDELGNKAVQAKLRPPKEEKAEVVEEKAEAPRTSSLDKVIIAVIIIAVLSLAALGYLAIQRGFIDISGLTKRASQDNNDSRRQVSSDIPEDHSLYLVANNSLRGTKHLKKFANDLYQTDLLLKEMVTPKLDDNKLTSEAEMFLDSLSELGGGLLIDYQEFEESCIATEDENVIACEGLLREQYMTVFGDLINMMGEVYIKDSNPVHAVYLVSDEIPDAISSIDQDKARWLEGLWSEVNYQRKQYWLNKTLEEELRQLNARLDTMVELHKEYQKELNRIPAREIRNGILNKENRQTIELFDNLMDTVEEMAIELEEYQQTLVGKALSDEVERLLDSILDLIKDDHETAFTEIYMIYAQDRALSHEVYVKLREHFDFVSEHWPRLEGDYQRIYTKYENEWADRWVSDN